MPLNVEQLILAVDQAESVAAEAVHVPVAVGRAAIREQYRDLVKRFRRERPEVPHHGRRLEIGLRISLLRMNEVAELQRVANEEHGRVVADPVPIAFLAIELPRKPAGLAFGLRRSFFTADSREAEKRRSAFAGRGKQARAGVAGHVRISANKMAVSAGAFGMDHAFGDALTVEMGHLFEEQKVVEND